MEVETLGFSGALSLVRMQNGITPLEDNLSVSKLHVYSPFHPEWHFKEFTLNIHLKKYETTYT